jgi:hypothetical protein
MNELRAHLETRMEDLAAAWLKAMFATLPNEGVGFLATSRDPMKNPMGVTMRAGADGVLRALLAGATREELEHRIDDLIHLRAVQGLLPSQALAFIPSLKGLLRREIGDREFPAAEFAEIDRAIDELLYLSFDVYVRCREQIYELRARSMRDRSYKLMERAGLLWEEGPEKESGMDRGEP